MDNFTPILKENYSSKKKKREIQHFAEGGAVEYQPEGFIPDHEFAPDPMAIEDPQSQMADKGVSQLSQTAAKAVDMGSMPNAFQNPAQEERPLETPTIDPVDLASGAVAAKMAPSVVDAIASGLKSDAFRTLVGNEVGSVGPGAIQKLQSSLGVPVESAMYNDKVKAAQELLAKTEAAIARGEAKPSDILFAKQKLKTAQSIATKNAIGKEPKMAEGGIVPEMPDSFFADGGMPEAPEGFIPDAEFKPDPIRQPIVDNQAENQTTPPGFIPDEEFKSDEDTYGTLGQQAITALEGAGQGVLGPLAPLAEKAFGVSPEGMRLREETNPMAHGLGEATGFIGSMLAGTGEAALVGKAGQGITKALKLGLEGSAAGSQIAASAVRAAAETALLQSGDEVSRLIKEDPNQSLQTAAAHVGLSGLLGGGVGAALGSIHPLWKATFGDKLGQVAADFKGRMNEHLTNPDPVSTVTEELTNHYTKIKDIADEVYGPAGLKAQDIAKAMPEMSEKITNQSQEIANKLQTSIDKMLKKPSTYPPRLTNKLQDDLNEYLMKVSGPDANPAQIFDATQNLKQATQSYAKFDKFVKPVDEAYDFVRDSKGLAKDLRASLEDPAVWGNAARRQEAINKGFSEFLPSLKDFEKKFTVEVSGEKVLDPGKINIYVNQIGKPNAEIKQSILRNFLDASEKYKKVIGDTHTNLGIDSPIEPSSLTASYNTLKEVTPGAKLADLFITKGLKDAGGKAGGALIGGVAGHTHGAGEIGAFLGAHILGPFFSSLLPAIAKPLLQREVNASGMKAAMDYGLAVAKGSTLLEKAASNVFKDEPVLAEHLMPTDKDRAKLTKQLTAIQDNPQSMMKENELSHYLPQHSIAMGSTAASAVTYLNSLRPNRDKSSLLDSAKVPSNAEKAAFTNAVTIAQQPMVVLNKIKNGTVTPADVKALQSIYPDLYKSMSNKLMTAMVTHLSKDKPVPYKTRLGLSMFTGMPLDSTMTASSIQAAQPQSAQNPQQNQQAPKTAHSTSKLGEINKTYMTPDQASAAHRAKKD